MSASDATAIRKDVRVHLTGEAGALPELRDALDAQPGILTVGLTARVSELAELNGSVDVVLHAVRDGARLDTELTLLRERTNAPIALAVDADGLLVEQALSAPVAEVVLLPASPEAIAFAIRRAGRTASRTPSHASDGRIVTVCSAKGGVGKTVLATNLAVSLARNGGRTLLVDLDLRFGDVAIMFGVTPAKTLADLAESPGDLDLEKLVGYMSVLDAGLHVLAAPARPEQGDRVDEILVRRALEVARASYDVIVLDTGGAFEPATLAALEIADEVLCVVGADLPGLKNTVATLRTFDLLGIAMSRISFAANRVGSHGGLKPGEVSTVLDCPPRFELPEERSVLGAVNNGQPVALARPRSSFVRAVEQMARALAPAAAKAVTRS
jgi:pilus assembly protein CpaE